MMAVAQLGARMHYAVPRLLWENGLLDVCYTDLYSRKGLLALSHAGPFQGVRAVRALRTRQHPALPASRVVHFPGFGMAYVAGRDRCRTLDDRFRHYVWGGRRFNELILKQLAKRSPTALYTFNSAGLELMQFARHGYVRHGNGQRGIRLIHEQTMAPHRIERELLRQEMDKHPAWASGEEFGKGSAAYADREEQELALADVVVCGSGFVRDSLTRLGVAPDSIRVIPYGVDDAELRPDAQRIRRVGEPLRVLTVGEVGLRKGSPYVAQAARQLGSSARFRLVGDYSRVPAQALAELRQCLELVGHVRRDQMADQYRWADVFLLPSVCEGSATATYEAMQYGLPLIVTPNTGSLVAHGREGYVVPVGDVDAIVTYLDQLRTSESLRSALSQQSAKRAREGSYEAYARRFMEQINRVL